MHFPEEKTQEKLGKNGYRKSLKICTMKQQTIPLSKIVSRLLLGFTRTGGNMFNGQLGMVAPPAGIGKMPKHFNSSVDRHHEVIAIFNELDGRF